MGLFEIKIIHQAAARSQFDLSGLSIIRERAEDILPICKHFKIYRDEKHMLRLIH
jgi:hypothetical protein